MRGVPAAAVKATVMCAPIQTSLQFQIHTFVYQAVCGCSWTPSLPGLWRNRGVCVLELWLVDPQVWEEKIKLRGIRCCLPLVSVQVANINYEVCPLK